MTSGLQVYGRGVRPSGYEPDELPDCSTPQWVHLVCASNNYIDGAARWQAESRLCAHLHNSLLGPSRRLGGFPRGRCARSAGVCTPRGGVYTAPIPALRKTAGQRLVEECAQRREVYTSQNGVHIAWERAHRRATPRPASPGASSPHPEYALTPRRKPARAPCAPRYAALRTHLPTK